MKVGKKMMIFFLLFLSVLLGVFPEIGISQTIYYSVNSGNFGTLSNWNTDSTGSGSSPSSIGSDVFIIRNGFSITSDDNYTIFSLKVRDEGSFNASTYDMIIGDTLVLDDGTINFGSGTVEVAGNFLIRNGTFYAGSGTISLISDLTITNSPEFYSETSTFSFNSNIAYTISSSIDIEFYKAAHRPGIGGTRTLTFSGANFSIAESFERGNRSQGISLSNGATFSYGSNATLIYSPETFSMTVSNVEWPETNGPANVTLNGSVDLVLNSNRTLTGTLILSQTNGNFVVSSGNTLTINGVLDRRTPGTRGITGTVQYASIGSTLRYQTSGATMIGDEWPENFPPEDLEMTITGQPADSLFSSGDINRMLARDLKLDVGQLSLGNGTLTVLGNVIGSEITGAAVIKKNTTLRIGNGTGNSEQQNVSGTITLNKLEIDKAESGASADELTVLMTSSAAFSFTNGGKLTIYAGILNLNGNSRFGGNSPDTLIINSNGILKTGGTSLTEITFINASNGKIEFTGSTPEYLPSDITIGIMEVNNSAGVLTTEGTLTVSDELVLTNGVITTSSNNILLLSAGATVSGTPNNNRMVQGPLQKEFSDVGSFIFPIGCDGTPSKFYRPATFEYTAGDFTGGDNIIEIEYSRSSFTPKTPPPGISQITSASHYILKSVANTPSDFEYYFTGNYEDGNFTPESRNRALVETTDSYIVATSNDVNETNNTVRSGPFSSLPVDNQFIVFGAGGTTITWDGGAGDGLWSSANNWNPDALPISTDDVIIDDNDATTVTIDGTTSAVAQTLTLGGTYSPTLIIAGTSSNPLRIYQTSGTPLTVNNNSVLRVVNSQGIKFDPEGTNQYDPDRTAYATTSTVEYQAGTVQADTYGNLIVNGATGSSTSGTIIVSGNFEKQGSSSFTASTDVSVAGTYTNQAGTATFNGNGLSMTGINFIVNGGSIGGTVTFAGSSAQTISGSTSPASFATLVLNNASGLTLNTPVQVSTALNLNNGLLNTASNLLTLLGTASATGNENSYIYGPLARTNTIGSKDFPIGKSVYRPVTTNLSGTSPVVQFEVFDTPPNQNFDAPLVRISLVRYWRGTLNSGSISGGQVTVEYGPGDGVQDGPDLRMAYSVDNTNANPYISIGGTGTGAGSGTITGTLPGTTLGYFTLGTVTLDNSLPVDLVAFNAIGKAGKVLLTWQTASEVNNSGFEIYRATSENGIYELVNQQLIPGQGNSTTSHFYEYLDTEVEEQTTYYYKLYSRDFNGTRNVYEKISTATVLALPREFRMAQNYPNPFNPTTRLSFDVAKESQVSIEVYNMLGQKIHTLLDNERLEPGVYDHIIWDAKDDAGNTIANGIYYLVFTAKDHHFRQVRKMVFMK